MFTVPNTLLECEGFRDLVSLSTKQAEVEKVKLFILCDNLYYRMVNEINQDKIILQKGFYNLCSKLLQDFMHDYEKYLKWLIQARIIESDPYYENRGISKCKGYKFSNKALEGCFVQIEIQMCFSTRLTLIRYEKLDRIRKLSRIQNHKKYPYLFKPFDEGRIIIDEKASVEYLENTYSRDQSKYWKVVPRQLNLIKQIVESDYRKLPDLRGESQRFYSQVVLIKKELRKHLYYKTNNGVERLVEVDIKNSQPFTSIILFNKEFWMGDSKIRIKEINKELTKYRYKYISLMFGDSSETQTGLEETTNQYINLTIQGTLYEFILEAAQDILPKGLKNADFQTKRNWMKKQILRIMYDFSRPNKKPPKIDCLIKELFPQVTTAFDFIKSFESGVIRKKRIKEFKSKLNVAKFEHLPKNYSHIYEDVEIDSGYTRLAIILQKIEAKLILERVCGSLYAENNDIPLITVHDSILTTEGYLSKVKERITSVYAEMVGEKPTLHVKQESNEILMKIGNLPNFSFTSNRFG